MEQVTDRIYVETSYPGTNVGLIVSERGLVMVDSPFMPEDALDFRRQVEDMEAGEVAYLINTDHHGDHVACDGFFTPNIVLQELSAGPFEASRAQMTRRAMEFASDPKVSLEVKEALPEMALPSPHITFSDAIAFDMGDLTIDVVHTGGHTVGTSYIFVPEESAVFCGDNVVNGRFPYLKEGIYHTWAEALSWIADLDAEIVIPGHEQVGNKELVYRLLRFMEDLETRAWDLFERIHEGDDPPKADRDLLPYFPGIEGYPDPDEEMRIVAVKRMFEQSFGVPAIR